MTAFNVWLDRAAELQVERDAAHACILDLVQAIECAWEDDPDALRDTFDHYAHARRVIGRPVTYHEGGPGGEHFHFLKTDEGECGYCDEVAQERAEQAEQVPR